jgi:hypothetical protein
MRQHAPKGAFSIWRGSGSVGLVPPRRMARFALALRDETKFPVPGAFPGAFALSDHAPKAAAQE